MTTSTLINDIVVVPDAPAIPGLTFRRFRGAKDYKPMADVRNSSRWADGVEYVTTPEDIPIIIRDLGNCDPYQDIAFVEAEGQLVGYGLTEWFKEDGKVCAHYQTLYLKPERREQKVLDALFQILERRTRQIAATSSDPHHVFRTEAYDTQPYLIALYQQEGYSPVRTFYSMVRPSLVDIPEISIPAGLEVRPALPEHYRQIWEDMREAFQDHWAQTNWDDSQYESWLQARSFRPELWKVAWDGDQVAGMVLATIDDKQNDHMGLKRGYTEPISVRRAWRRKGLAKALLAQSLRELKTHGMSEAALGVDAEGESGALHLYENLGFRLVKREIIYEKPL